MGRAPASMLSACIAVFALAACGAPESTSALEEPVTAGGEQSGEAAAAEEPAASILRPEVSAEVEAPAPEPLEVTISFPQGATISEEAERQLSAILNSPALAAGWPIELRGHSDSDGSDAANLKTSRNRAEAVAEWLTSRGVASDRIHIIAFGEQNPVAPNANPDGTPNAAGRALNKRVEVVISDRGVMTNPAQPSVPASNGSENGRVQSTGDKETP